MTTMLPRPYGGAAVEPPEPVTVGECPECGEPFGADEEVYVVQVGAAVGEPLHERCAAYYLADRGYLRMASARDVFDAWGGREL